MSELVAEPLRYERVQPEAESYWLDPGGPIGCLLLHGWLGSPAELRPLAEQLAARGIACYAHRLPGHGTAPEDLLTVTSLDWQAAVEAGLQHVRRRKQYVFLLGFGAGGALALYSAAAQQGAAWLRGIITIATPVRIDDWRIWLTPVLRLVLPWMSARRIRSELDAQLIAEAGLDLYDRYPTTSLQQVARLIRETRPRLPLVQAPLLIVHGRQDRLVPPEQAQIIHDEAASEDRAVLWLDQSAHFVPLGPDIEEVARVSAAFMQARVPDPPAQSSGPSTGPKAPHRLPSFGLIRSRLVP